VVLSLVLLPAGCGGGGSSGNGACSTSGTGTLVVNVTGLPSDLSATVTVQGPAGTQTATMTKTFTGIAAGSYTISAARVTRPDPIVRTVYTPMVMQGTAANDQICVGGAAMSTVTVKYVPLPTSNKLWIANSNPPNDANTQGYESSLLAAAGTVAASVAVQSGAGRKEAFDRDGNLWALGGTTADSTVLMLSADALAVSGTRTPARTIGVPSITCLPAVADLAFDSSGNLWFTSACSAKVYKLSAAQVAAGGTAVTPTLAIATLAGAEGLAFDKSGNLWVSNDDAQLLRFDAASLASASATPALTLTAKTSATGGDLHPGWLAFDATGKLWTADFGGNIIFPFATADLAGTGTKGVVPAVQITVGVGALLEGMAFDEGGGLWITLDAGAFGRLSPAQLGTSSGAGAPTTPDRVIPASGLGSGEDIALYPAPAALPLYSALP
jgi:hypothetical protein